MVYSIWATIALCGLLCRLIPMFAAVPEPSSPVIGATRAVPGQFVDITDKAGIHFSHTASHSSHQYLLQTMGSGVALFDCDNENRLDILLVNGAPFPDQVSKGFIPQKNGPQDWTRLYHQRSNGTFEDITSKAGLQGVGYGMGVAVGDYDNDGYEDLFVTGYGGNHLYRNNGDCTFKDVTEVAGVGGSGWSSSATWVDLDNDGLLDLVVLRYVVWDWDDLWCGDHREGYRVVCHPDMFPAIPMLVYHNDGHSHFTEVSKRLGLDKPGKALGVAIADYDHDGKLDILVANDSMPEFLFHQKPDGTFAEVGLESQVAVDADGRTFAGMGVDFADYDNDGRPDVVITDLANQRYALYHNHGDGTFDYATGTSGLANITLLHSGWGVRFLDYDNDGWKDLMIAQGHDVDTIERINPQLHYREPMMLLRNERGRFVDVSSISGEVLRQAWVGRGLAIGDIDNDGRIDAVVTTNGGSAYVLHNETVTPNHWITLQLLGHKSNRDGIGAIVKLTTAHSAQWVTATASSSYLSASDRRVHFGLGADTVAEAIEVQWPSGIRQTLRDIRGDQFVLIKEPGTD